MIFMICYDVTDPKRLNKTAKTLERFGLRIQKSFFQCEMERELLDSLIKKLLRIINEKGDSLFIYPLCEDCSRKAITDGTGEIIKLQSFEIL